MSIGAILRQQREKLGLTQDHVAAQAGISKPYLSNVETGKANPPSDGVLTLLERVLQFEAGQLMEMAHLERMPSDVRQRQETLEAEVQKLRGVLGELYNRMSSAPRTGMGSVDMDSIARTVRTEANVRQLSLGRAIPVINKVTAGYPHHFTDLDYPPSVADEYVRCVDLSDPQAFAARVVGDSMEPTYHEGDVVVFSPNKPTVSGMDCFVRFERDCSTTFKRFFMDDENTIRLQPLNNKYRSESYAREAITGLWPAVFRIERIG